MADGFPTKEELTALIEALTLRRGCIWGTDEWDFTVDDFGELINELKLSSKGDPKKFRAALEERFGDEATRAFSIQRLADHEIPVPTAEEIQAMKGE